MADEDEKGIDPRYDPAFQRGYRGAPAEATANRRPAPDIARQTAPEPVAKVSVVREPAASAVPAGVADVDADTQSNPDADGVESDAPLLSDVLPPLRTNPYVYALAIMGVLFVVVGLGIEIAITYAQFSGQNGFSSAESRIMQTIGYLVAGPLSTVGLAILVGLVFFAGWRWRLRPGRNTQ